MKPVVEFDLQIVQERLAYYQTRNTQKPNRVYEKWVAIYSDRLEQLKKKLLLNNQSGTDRS